jgi:hypothetical protein
LDIHAICVSSVLHHLYDYLAPLEQLRELCPALELVFITHEPLNRGDLIPPGCVQRIYNRAIRQLDVRLSRTVLRPAEPNCDDPVADYHAFKEGIAESEIERMLAAQGFDRRLISRCYNMRRTTLASVVDNVLFRALRNDIFPITMFTLAMAQGNSDD